MRDCIEIQQLAMAMIRDRVVKPSDLAVLARAYTELEECKRKLKMRPLPRSIDVSLPHKSIKLLSSQVSGSET